MDVKHKSRALKYSRSVRNSTSNAPRNAVNRAVNLRTSKEQTAGSNQVSAPSRAHTVRMTSKKIVLTVNQEEISHVDVVWQDATKAETVQYANVHKPMHQGDNMCDITYAKAFEQAECVNDRAALASCESAEIWCSEDAKPSTSMGESIARLSEEAERGCRAQQTEYNSEENSVKQAYACHARCVQRDAVHVSLAGSSKAAPCLRMCGGGSHGIVDDDVWEPGVVAANLADGALSGGGNFPTSCQVDDRKLLHKKKKIGPKYGSPDTVVSMCGPESEALQVHLPRVEECCHGAKRVFAMRDSDSDRARRVPCTEKSTKSASLTAATVRRGREQGNVTLCRADHSAGADMVLAQIFGTHDHLIKTLALRCYKNVYAIRAMPHAYRCGYVYV
jgi:hypothetical protein